MNVRCCRRVMSQFLTALPQGNLVWYTLIHTHMHTHTLMSESLKSLIACGDDVTHISTHSPFQFFFFSPSDSIYHIICFILLPSPLPICPLSFPLYLLSLQFLPCSLLLCPVFLRWSQHPCVYLSSAFLLIFRFLSSTNSRSNSCPCHHLTFILLCLFILENDTVYHVFSFKVQPFPLYHLFHLLPFAVVVLLSAPACAYSSFSVILSVR